MGIRFQTENHKTTFLFFPLDGLNGIFNKEEQQLVLFTNRGSALE